jgi:chromosome segregation ATPase
MKELENLEGLTKSELIKKVKELTELIQKSSNDVCTISKEIKKVNEENERYKNQYERYKNQYEDMKNQKEKAEKDYICLVEQLKHTNRKTDEMNKRIQELEAVLTNFEQRNKNNLEKYEKSCKENEELKKEIIRVNDEKNIYERGITKLIYTLGKK